MHTVSRMSFLGVFLFLVVSVGWCQDSNLTTLTWNGTEVTEPILIFQDELLFDNTSNAVLGDLDAPGALVCRCPVAQPQWRDVDNDIIPNVVRDIWQIRTAGPGYARLSRNRTGSTSDDYNGLITCRLDIAHQILEDVIASYKYVALYIREAGHGVITSNEVSLSSSSLNFTANPPTFTLYGDTSGGPPVTRMWTRNGQVITNDDSHDISIAVNGGTAILSPSDNVRLNCRYRSTLVVRGNLPGMYQYSVGNRVTDPMVMHSITIQAGNSPNSVMLTQDTLTSVTVTWTVTSTTPAPTGYQLNVTHVESSSMSLIEDIGGTSSSFSLINDQYGDYVVQVLSLYTDRLPGVSTAMITVRAVVSNVQVQVLSDTSVEVTWDPLPITDIVGFRVYYSQVQNRKNQSIDDTSVTVDGLVSSATITGLSPGVQYQFQVAVRARLSGEIFEAERSTITEVIVITVRGGSSGGVSLLGAILGTLIGAIVFACALVGSIIFAVKYFHRQRHVHNNKKEGSVYYKMGCRIDMQVNEAYGKVSVLSGQPSPQGDLSSNYEEINN